MKCTRHLHEHQEQLRTCTVHVQDAQDIHKMYMILLYIMYMYPVAIAQVVEH